MGFQVFTTKRLDYYLFLMFLNKYLSGLERIINSLTFPFIILNGYVVITKLVLMVGLSNHL